MNINAKSVMQLKKYNTFATDYWIRIPNLLIFA